MKEFKEKMYEQIKQCARCERNIAELCFNIKDELQLERAHKVKEELISKGFVSEIYKDTNAVLHSESGILSAKW